MARPSLRLMHMNGKYSQFKRYLSSGVIGNLIGWVIYNSIYILNPITWNKATISWIFGWIIGVALQHDIHHRWTFLESETSYLKSLSASYVAYSFGFVISTFVLFILIEKLYVNIQIGWLVAVLSGVIVNYFFLKNHVFKTKIKNTT